MSGAGGDPGPVQASGEVRGCCHPGLGPKGTYADVQESNGRHQDISIYAQGVYTRQRELVAVMEKVLSVYTHLERQTDQAGSAAADGPEFILTCQAS